MPTIRIISREEAQRTRAAKVLGIRKQRMNEFDQYVTALTEAPEGQAVVYEDIEEDAAKFVLTLRGALKRAGIKDAEVRKIRGKAEVRVWRPDPNAAPKPEKPAKSEKAPKAEKQSRPRPPKGELALV